MQDTNGIDACRQIRSALPDTKVLMLTSHEAAPAVEASVLAGASGYLLKNGGREDLLRGIRAVARGESLLSPSVTSQVLERFADLTRKEQHRENDLLSNREKEVLVLVAQGMTNREIASELIISENTVRNHLSHILDKLDLSRRSQVAVYAAQRGMLKQEPGAEPEKPPRASQGPHKRVCDKSFNALIMALRQAQGKHSPPGTRCCFHKL